MASLCPLYVDVIASDGKIKLRRTPKVREISCLRIMYYELGQSTQSYKMMICFSNTANILNLKWLEDSAKDTSILDTDGYLVVDKEAEKKYGFSMKETVENGRLARQDRGGVLGNFSVYICAGVAGNCAPSSKELSLIIESAGGKCSKSLAKIEDSSQLIVITNDPPTKSQQRELKKAQGAHIRTTTWLFDVMTKQELALDDDTKGGGSTGKATRKKRTTSSSEKGKAPSKRARRNS